MPLPDRARDRARGVLLTLLTAAVSVTLAACSGGDDPGSRGGADRGPVDLPGVHASAVGEELIEEDTPGKVVAVDLERGVTVDQATAVFEKVDELAPDETIVTLDCGTATTELSDQDDTCDAATSSSDAPQGPARHGAEVLLAASRAFPEAVVTVRSRKDVGIDLGAPGPDDVAAALDRVRADPVLSTTGDLTVGSGSRSPDPRFGVSTVPPLTDSAIALWRRLTPTLATLQLNRGAALSLEIGASGTRIAAGIEVPGVVPPEQLTPASHGAELWPFLHAQLDVVATLPAGTTYTVGNAYRPVPEAAQAHGHDAFLDVRVGASGRPDDLGRTWNVDAARYLASMS
jgi:hypothetical protein